MGKAFAALPVPLQTTSMSTLHKKRRKAHGEFPVCCVGQLFLQICDVDTILPLRKGPCDVKGL